MNNNSSNSLNSNSGGGSNNNRILSFKNKSFKVFIIAFFVILFVFCIIMIYIASAYPKKIVTADMTTEVLLNYIHDCKNNPLEISAKNLPASTAGNEYSLTFWVFINSLDSDFLKNKTYSNLDIITKGKVEILKGNIKAINTDKEQPIKVYLKNKSNTLQIDMQKESGSTDLLAGKKGCYSYNSLETLDAGVTRKFDITGLSGIDDPESAGGLSKINEVDGDKFCTKESRRVGNQYFGMLRTSKSSVAAAAEAGDTSKVEGAKESCKYLTSLDLMNFNNDLTNSIIQKDISTNADDCYFTQTQNDKKTQLEILIPLVKAKVEEIKEEAADASDADKLGIITGKTEEYKISVTDAEHTDTDANTLYEAASTFFGIPTAHDESKNYEKLIEDIELAIAAAEKARDSIVDTHIYIDAVDKKEYLKPCRAEQFPIQRWNCITLNVHNNIVDLFMDGKLLHTCVYDGNLELNNDPIIIGNRGGFDGYVSNVTWSNKSLDSTKIYEIYSQGPRIRLTANDRIKYMFMRKPKDLEAGLEQQESINQESTGRL